MTRPSEHSGLPVSENRRRYTTGPYNYLHPAYFTHIGIDAYCAQGRLGPPLCHHQRLNQGGVRHHLGTARSTHWGASDIPTLQGIVAEANIVAWFVVNDGWTVLVPKGG